MDKIITREEYMDDKYTHDAYYAQFVTEGIKHRILSVIPKTELMASRDPHLNDIPMKKWDLLAGALVHGANIQGIPGGGISHLMAISFKDAGDYYTLAGAVCVLKTAARQIIQGETGKQIIESSK